MGKEGQKRWARQQLLGRHPDKGRLVDVLLESQMYADYLDRLEREASAL